MALLLNREVVGITWNAKIQVMPALSHGHRLTCSSISNRWNFLRFTILWTNSWCYYWFHENHTGTLRSEKDAWQPAFQRTVSCQWQASFTTVCRYLVAKVRKLFVLWCFVEKKVRKSLKDCLRDSFHSGFLKHGVHRAHREVTCPKIRAMLFVSCLELTSYRVDCLLQFF